MRGAAATGEGDGSRQRLAGAASRVSHWRGRWVASATGGGGGHASAKVKVTIADATDCFKGLACAAAARRSSSHCPLGEGL